MKIEVGPEVASDSDNDMGDTSDREMGEDNSNKGGSSISRRTRGLLAGG